MHLDLQVDESDGCAEHAKISFERSTFSTRAVNVRFNDEQFLLNDCVFFRVEKVPFVCILCPSCPEAPFPR